MIRRDRMEIMVSILNTCTSAKGVNKTKIVYQANLNFRTVNPYLDLLETNGLIQVTGSGHKLYKTTSKGAELINDATNVMQMLKL